MGKTEKKMTGYPSIDKVHLKGTRFWERNPIIPNISISNAIDMVNIFRSNVSAVNCLDLMVTYGEMKNDSEIISKSFIELGVKCGDIITIACPNLYQPLACFKAANRIGAVTTFLSEFTPIEEIKKYLNMYKSPIFINYDKEDKYNQEILRDTDVKYIITLESTKVNHKEFDNLAKIDIDNRVIKYHQLEIIARWSKKKVKTWFDGKQNALILYTSGSTGEPKSLLFTNENLLAACIYYKHSARLPKETPENRKWMGVVPFMYPYGFVASVLGTLLCGREVILCPDLSENKLVEYYRKKPNTIYGSPAFLELTKRNIPEEMDLSSVEMFVSGGDFLSVSQSMDGINFFKQHGANIQMCNSSGNGEVCGCVTNAMNIPYRPETVGKLAIGPDFVVIDSETNEEIKYGEPGILCVAGKHVYKGYYENKKLTEETLLKFKNKSYYITGNYGILDTDGYFTMLGRSTRFYINSTLNKIYCEHVQKVLSNVEEVDSCAVVPMPDKKKLYVGKAFVVLKQGVEKNEEMAKKILQDCRTLKVTTNTGSNDILQPYEVPDSIEFVDELPHTFAGKIDYQALEKETQHCEK